MRDNDLAQLMREIEHLRARVDRLEPAELPILDVACRVYNSSAISHTSSGNWQALTFDSETLDTDDIHSTVTNTGRLVAQRNGVYQFFGCVSFAANGTGWRGVRVMLNGATTIAADWPLTPDGSYATTMTISSWYPFSADDYIELEAFQDSGGSLNINAVAPSPTFGMARIALYSP